MSNLMTEKSRIGSVKEKVKRYLHRSIFIEFLVIAAILVCPAAARAAEDNPWMQKLKAGSEVGSWQTSLPFGIRSAASYKIDPQKTYRLSGDFRVIGANSVSPFYFTLEPYDASGRMIYPVNVSPVSFAKIAVLAEKASKGDTKLKLRNAGSWKILTTAFAVVFNAKADFSDLPNFNVSPWIKKGGLKKISADIWELELQSPMKEDYPAGTEVRCHASGPFFIMCAADGKKPLTPQWQTFQGTISGIKRGSEKNHWRPGTVSAKIRIFCSARGAAVELKNVKFEEVK